MSAILLGKFLPAKLFYMSKDLIIIVIEYQKLFCTIDCTILKEDKYCAFPGALPEGHGNDHGQNWDWQSRVGSY